MYDALDLMIDAEVLGLLTREPLRRDPPKPDVPRRGKKAAKAKREKKQ